MSLVLLGLILIGVGMLGAFANMAFAMGTDRMGPGMFVLHGFFGLLYIGGFFVLVIGILQKLDFL